MDLLPLSLTRSDPISKSSGGSSISGDKVITPPIERRKPNWTECENVFLLDQFSIHREILTCKATDASTNLRKQEVWRIICSNLNMQNSLVRRTPAEVRRKWKNLVTAAKKELWELRHQAHTLGTTRKISDLSQRVIQLHSSAASANNASALSALFLQHQQQSQHGDTVGSSLEDFKYGLNNNLTNNGDYEKDYYSNGSGSMTSTRLLDGSSSSHFTPIVQLTTESVSSPTGSPLSSSDSRNEFDSGIYEEATDLRINVNKSGLIEQQRKTSETTTTEEDLGPPQRVSSFLIPSGRLAFVDNDLCRLKLELQIDVLKLRKRKLEMEVRRLRRNPQGAGNYTSSAFLWRRSLSNKK